MSLIRPLRNLKYYVTRDYDTYFWDHVREFRILPGARAHPHFLAYIRFGAAIPEFLLGQSDRARRWLETARHTYSDEPLTQLIAGELISKVSFISGDQILEIERLCFLSEVHIGIGRFKDAVSCYRSALKTAYRMRDEGYIQHCSSQLSKLSLDSTLGEIQLV